MRRDFCILVLITLIFSLFFSAYADCTVEIVKTDVWWESPENFGAFLRADIYCGGDSIPPSNNFYYEWHGYFSNLGYWKIIKTGYGENEAHSETLPGEYMQFYVVVTDTSNTYFTTITSEVTEQITMPEQGAKPVAFYAYDHNGNNIYPTVQPRHWRYTIDEWRMGYRGFLTRDWNEIIQATPDFLPNTQDKFKYWNNNFANILNYNSFLISETVTKIESYFKLCDTTVTITTQFVEGVDVAGDSIEFKDPWVVDEGNTQFYTAPYGYHSLGMNAPFLREAAPLHLNNNSKYDGIFLNQGYNQGNWEPPYYSVRAPQEQVIPFHGENITWYFQRWEGDHDSVMFQHPDQQSTPIVFKKDGAIARAVYKGHLVSSTVRALQNNGQAKLFNNGNRIHMIYEDGDQIYYTYTDDNGAHWQHEFRVSDGEEGTNQYPSLCPDPLGGLWIVWQYYNSTPIIYARHVDSDGNWGNIEIVQLFITNVNMEMTPVAVWDEGLHVIYRNQMTGLEGLWVCHYGDTQNVKIPTTSIHSLHPSVTENFDEKDHLVWEENGQIYYMQFYYDGINKEYHFEERELVSDVPFCITHCWPSITQDRGYNIHVMWQAYHTALEQEVLVHGYRPGSTPNKWQYSIISGKEDDYMKPSLTGYTYSENNTGELDAAWENSSNGLVIRGYYDGDQWSAFYGTDYGYSPNFGINHAPYRDVNFAYRRDSDTPMRLRLFNDEHEREEPLSFDHHRVGIIDGLSSILLFEAGEFTINGQTEGLMPYSDSLYALHSGSWKDLFRTGTFTIEGNVKLTFYHSFQVIHREKFQSKGKTLFTIRLEVVDADNGRVIYVPYQLQIGPMLPANNSQLSSAQLNVPGFHRVYIRANVIPLNFMNYHTRVVDWYGLKPSGDEKFSNRYQSPKITKISTIPDRYALRPNYPNPFNPTTTIGFDLPEACRVELVIYDISGRTIRTLARGGYAAGRHQVVWDGTDEQGNSVASGVYVYRLVAGEHVFVRKMVLMK